MSQTVGPGFGPAPVHHLVVITPTHNLAGAQRWYASCQCGWRMRTRTTRPAASIDGDAHMFDIITRRSGGGSDA